MAKTTITLAEWEDYYSVQKSGRINMWLHPLIGKFAPDGNWEKAFDWFETGSNDGTLVIEDN